MPALATPKPADAMTPPTCCTFSSTVLGMEGLTIRRPDASFSTSLVRGWEPSGDAEAVGACGGGAPGAPPPKNSSSGSAISEGSHHGGHPGQDVILVDV